MRKKFFAMYALAGALVASPVFTSCIDDTESASVTAIRNANAEKIKAATAMQQAMHEIEKAKAEADLAYKKLEIEAKEISNEQAKAQLEERKAYFESQMLYYQKQIIVNAEYLKEYQDATLARLATSYQTALDNVATINFNILQQQTNITQLKAGITTVQAYVANRTDYYNAKIAETEAAIEALKEAQAENLDAEELEAKIAELKEVSDEALNAVKEWAIKYGAGLNTYNAGTIAGLDMSDTDLATAKAMSDYSSYYNTDAEGYPVLKEAAVATNKETLAANLKKAEKDLADEIARIGKDTDKKDTKYSKITINNITTGIETVTEDFTLYALLAEVKETILGAPKAGETEATGAYIILEKLEAAVKAAKDALAANTDDTQTATLEGNVATAEAKLLAYKTDKSAATDATAVDYDGDSNPDGGFAWAEGKVAEKEQAILTAKDGLVALETAVATAKENIEKFEAAIATFAGEDFEAYKEAAAALKEVKEAYTTANAEYTALNNAYNTSGNSVDYAFEIYQKEEDLADLKQDLAQISVWIYSGNSGISLPNGPTGVYPATEEEIEVVIAWIEEKIETMKIQLAIAEEQAAKIKAELDAYLETEEGGEAEA